MADERALLDVNREPTLLAVGSSGGEIRQLKCDDTTGALLVELTTGDIELGAVELKNATDDTRAVIGDGSAATTSDDALYVADANVKSDTSTMVTTLGTIDTDTGNIATSVAILDDWDATEDSAAPSDGVAVMMEERTSQATALDNGDAGRPVMLNKEQVMAGFDWASFFLAVGERDPIDRKCLLTSYSYSNVPNATPQTIEFEMQGFSDFSVHIEKTGGTDTFDVDYLASNEGTATTDDWIDITAGMTFVGGSATTDHIATPTIKFTPKAVQIEITTAGGSNDADFNVFIYKKY